MDYDISEIKKPV